MPKKVKKMDKRGVDLTLNTIIIAVLVVLVLVVVVVFFFGGFKQLTDRIKSTFFITTAGIDETLAVETCRQYCDQAQRLPQALRKNSAYCTQAFIIEGKSQLLGEGVYSEAFKCGEKSKIEAPGRFKAQSADGHLSVSCPDISCE